MRMNARIWCLSGNIDGYFDVHNNMDEYYSKQWMSQTFFTDPNYIVFSSFFFIPVHHAYITLAHYYHVTMMKS